ncbi:MAG: hypothetical protein AB8F78_01640 [Saprospiraceae bacterium]
MNFKDLEQKLLQFSEKYDLVNTAMVSCRTAISNTAADFPGEGHPIDEVDIKFERLYFVFSQDLFSSSLVKTQLGLYYVGKISTEITEPKRFGQYTLDTDEYGAMIDDWLVYK